MKNRYIVKSAILAILSLFAVSCNKAFNEITEMSLARCLTPTDLAAKVDIATGVDVTFSWKVGKDAEKYKLIVYADEEMTDEILNREIASGEVPYTIKLTADQQCYFKVKALSSKREDSNWAIYDGSFKTYAVKDNLFPVIIDRTATSLTLEWSMDAADYREVTHITCAPVKGGDDVTYTLNEADIEAAEATITGLSASTEYQVVLYYMSASRGGVDVWTPGEQGTATAISNAADLTSIMTSGGDIYLKLDGSPYSIGSIKPASSVRLIGEVGPDGEKPEVICKIELTAALAENSNFYAEGVKFNGSNGTTANSRIVEHTGGTLNLGNIEFVNCEITGYQAGFFYGNQNDVLKIGILKFDSCDIHDIPGSGGDAVDIRKTTEISKIVFRNNTISNGLRTFFRIDASDAIKIGAIEFQNNTVKSISTVNDTNNRGIFAIRVPTEMTLKKNLFLWENGGLTESDKAQLFQDNAATVVPTLSASDNYCYAEGVSFFAKVSAAEAGIKLLDADPCYNSKGNFFHLSNQELIGKKVGASKWWIPYAAPAEDLTQNVLEGAHTWNLQDASLFAGEVKAPRVRDELLLMGSEAVPMNADNGINFLSAATLTRKGVPTDGYISFKVNAPGSVDLEVAEGGGNSVVVAVSDDNGFAVKGGAVASEGAGVQKVLVPAVNGEATVFLYPTGAISLKKLAWSKDTKGGNKVLPAPQPSAEPVTLTEGDATDVTFTWEAVPNAASYAIVFNKKILPAQSELSYTVDAATIGGLKAGLYNFTVQALPGEDDIYYTKSEIATAAIAIQPKGGGGQTVTETLTWDFSTADWQTELGKSGATSGTDFTPASGSVSSVTVEGLTFYSQVKWRFNANNIQFSGAGVNATTGNLDRHFKFTAPEAGTLKVKTSNTGNSADAARKVYVKVGDDVQEISGGFASSAPEVIEFSIPAGEVFISTTGNGLRFYTIEFTYSYTTGGDTPKPINYDWDFSAADWQTELGKSGATSGTDFTPASESPTSVTVEGLTFYSQVKWRFNANNIQFSGAGVNATTGNLDRRFVFTAPEAGTLKVKTSNTGNSEDATRKVYVKVGDDVQEISGGFASSAPGMIEFSIPAGEVFISTTGNGLRFYEIHYSN